MSKAVLGWRGKAAMGAGITDSSESNLFDVKM
jgi:hypothetical protein